MLLLHPPLLFRERMPVRPSSRRVIFDADDRIAGNPFAGSGLLLFLRNLYFNGHGE